MMTKKDFIAVAEIVREHGNAQIARELAKIFLQQNPRFDSQRFLDACGVK